MASNFDKVSRMNEAFGNAKGHPATFSIEKLSKQLLSVPDELGETFVAMGADKQRVDALVVLFKAGLAALDFPNKIDVTQVRDGITDQHVFLYGAHHLMGVNADADMDSVIGGLMTRFIKNEEDEIATIKKHAEKGVIDVYFEGEYPRRVMKSSCDQPDAPKGKFMKSASYKDPVFYPVACHVSFSRTFGPSEPIFDYKAPVLDQSSFDHAAEQAVLSAPDYGTADAPKLAPATIATLENSFNTFDERLAAIDAVEEIRHPDAGKTYTFEKFVEYGRYRGANIVNGMPWSFNFHGFPVTHETDEHYLICLPSEPHTIHFFKGQEVMIMGNGIPRVYTPSRFKAKADKIVGEMNDEARKLLDRHNASIGASK